MRATLPSPPATVFLHAFGIDAIHKRARAARLSGQLTRRPGLPMPLWREFNHKIKVSRRC